MFKDRPTIFNAYVTAASKHRMMAVQLPTFLSLSDEKQDVTMEAWLGQRIGDLQSEKESAQVMISTCESEIAKLEGAR